MKTVLLTDPIAPAGEEPLSAAATVVRAPDSAPATIRRLARDADGVIIRSKLSDDLFDALIEALRAKRIAGAMLDVYEHYRLAPGHPLFALDNVVLTPHLAAVTQESRARASVAAADEMLRILRGERPRNRVNPEVLKKELT